MLSKAGRRIALLAVLSLLIVMLLCTIGVWRIVAVPSSPFVTRSGATLISDGKPFYFTGFNAFSIASLHGVNGGCGPMFSDEDLDTFFASLRPDSVVRFWAFQTLAYNIETQTFDFAGIDRAVAAAEKHGVRVILTLGNHWVECDNEQKSEWWYQEGYREVRNPRGFTPLSYWNYLQLIVPRYADSPTVAMWEPMNEPEASSQDGCSPTANQTLRTFFDTVGAEIKRLDPNHLVSSGVIGGSQCGINGPAYQALHESPYLDVASYHDYSSDDDESLSSNRLQRRIDEIQAIKKPLFIGEVGIKASQYSGDCLSLMDRRDKLQATIDAQFTAGVAGVLLWSYVPTAGDSCDYNLFHDDPVMELLRDYELPRGDLWRFWAFS